MNPHRLGGSIPDYDAGYQRSIYICNHQSSGKGKLREIISQNASDVCSTCASVFPWIMHTAKLPGPQYWLPKSLSDSLTIRLMINSTYIGMVHC